jgi:hypothetical protein
LVLAKVLGSFKGLQLTVWLGAVASHRLLLLIGFVCSRYFFTHNFKSFVQELSKSLYLLKHIPKMNITDKGSIFIVSLFYIITLASGYMIHDNQMIGQKNEVERLIITINNNEINTENNSTIVYEDVGRPQPIQKIYAAASVVAISSIYEQKGYELDHITEFLKKVVDQEVVITRIWFSKKN